MPMPTLPRPPARCSSRAHHLADGADGRGVVVARRRHAMLGQRGGRPRPARRLRSWCRRGRCPCAAGPPSCAPAVIGPTPRARQCARPTLSGATAWLAANTSSSDSSPARCSSTARESSGRAGSSAHFVRLQPGKLKKSQHARGVLGKERKPLQGNGFGRFPIDGGSSLCPVLPSPLRSYARSRAPILNSW